MSFEFYRKHSLSTKFVFVLLGGAILCCGTLLADPEAKCALVVAVMACFWMTEIMPLAVTALIPLVFYPILGIEDAKNISTQYFKDTNVLVFGGLVFAVCIEHWRVHTRVALITLSFFGSNRGMILLSFMLIGWILSMWISNTATSSMLIPIAVAVADEFDPRRKALNHRWVADTEKSPPEGQQIVETSIGTAKLAMDESTTLKANGNRKKDEEAEESLLDSFLSFKRGLLLSVAYSCSIGGTATLTGTGPNALLLGNIEDAYGKDTRFNFGTFMIYSFPESLVCLALAWTVLYLIHINRPWRKSSESQDFIDKDSFERTIKQQYTGLGPLKTVEKIVFGFFIALAALWFFRSPKFITGWSDVLKLSDVADSTVVIAVVITLFACPSFSTEEEADKTVLTWPTVHEKMSWNMLFLLGGGFAMAHGVKTSGLDVVIMNALKNFEDIPNFLLLFIIICVVGFLTEFTSNTSTASVIQPIMSSLAKSMGVNPFLFMIPTTIACSFAFCFPVATPPNAIAFSEGTLRISDMIKCGVILNFCCFFVTTIFAFTWGSVIFNMNEMPDWAYN